MPAQIIQMMAFTQIMAIRTSWISLQDHLKGAIVFTGLESLPKTSICMSYNSLFMKKGFFF